MTNAVRNALRESEPRLAVGTIETLNSRIARSIGVEQLLGWLTAAVGAAALGLACLGLYGTISYEVRRRTAELGIRIALGAERRNVRAMVLRHVSLMMGAGTLIGLALGVGLGRLSESLLFELKGYDPVVLATATVLLVLVVFGASAVPTYRATQIDPMRALRHE